MDLNKSRDFFNPEKVTETCHVIGCGSIGSNVAELLVRYGIKNIVLWDYDFVETHNIANQIYNHLDIGKAKTEALYDKLIAINPEVKNTITLKEEYTNEQLQGYIFMCVDSVEVRKKIVDIQMYNLQVKAIFDFRTTLLEGQCYYADWNNPKDRVNLSKTLDFTHEEAKVNAPISACGFELSVAPVVRMTAELGICNFTNMINKKETKHLILINPYDYFMDAM